MDKNRLIQEVKELRNKTGCGLSECRKAIEFCEEHPECVPIAYLIVKGIAVNRKGPFLEQVKGESEYQKIKGEK